MISQNQEVISQKNRSVNTNQEIFYLNSYNSIYFSKTNKGDVCEFDFCFATHQALEQGFSHSRELISLCNNNLHVIWN